MALPASGTISLANVNTELGAASNTTRSLNDAAVRSLFGKPSGGISLSDGYGKANSFKFNPVISAHTANYNIRAAAIAAGWDQVKPLVATVTINSGVHVGSTSTGAYAFSTGSGFPAGSSLTLINNGLIAGAGGAGGVGTSAAGSPGGPGLLASAYISITNNYWIGGGGGGGGRSGGADGDPTWGWVTGSAGGVGAGAGASGYYANAAGQGQRYVGGGFVAGAGGSGGTLGTTGSTGAATYRNGSELWWYGSAGGAPGVAIAGNAYITWNVAGTRLGAIT